MYNYTFLLYYLCQFFVWQAIILGPGVRMNKKFIGCYNPSVILTYIGLISSIISIYLSYHGNFRWAIFCIMISGLCDMFDGTIARKIDRYEQEKKFGIQIDSLCDLVCFGVSPAYLGITLYRHNKLEIIGLFAGICIVLAAIIRLAYFNVIEEERQQNTDEKRDSYQGLPVTNLALITPLAYCLGSLVSNEEILPIVYSIVLFFTAFLFVWNFRVPKIYGKANYMIIGLALLLFVAVLLV